MAMGRRKPERQEPLFVTGDNVPRSQGHPFYKALNRLLAEARFDSWIEGCCLPFYDQDESRGQRSITTAVPIFMGDAARRIIDVSAFFTPLPTLGRSQPRPYSDGQAIQIGPFTVTPLAIDHSAHDSYCLLVEADGKTLLYSGDLRAHGRKAELFQRLVRNPPPDIDVLICEGTRIGRIADFSFQDESAVANRMTELFKDTKGMCLVWCSSQNTDRIASVFQAASESGRKLILDLYTAEIMRAADDDTLPKPGRDGVKVYLPQSQKARIIREQAWRSGSLSRSPRSRSLKMIFAHARSELPTIMAKSN